MTLRMILCFTMTVVMASWCYAEEVPPPSVSEPEIEYQLIKYEYRQAERTTYFLNLKSETQGGIYEATLALASEGYGAGRIPLQRFPNQENEGVRFRISCLSNQFAEESSIYLRIVDQKTGKTLQSVRVWLKDAEIAQKPYRGT